MWWHLKLVAVFTIPLYVYAFMCVNECVLCTLCCLCLACDSAKVQEAMCFCSQNIACHMFEWHMQSWVIVQCTWPSQLSCPAVPHTVMSLLMLLTLKLWMILKMITDDIHNIESPRINNDEIPATRERAKRETQNNTKSNIYGIERQTEYLFSKYTCILWPPKYKFNNYWRQFSLTIFLSGF